MAPYNVLFICSGNSARSVIAEALLNLRGAGRFQAFSAGSQPKGLVQPAALEALERCHVPAGTPRSKSWDEFVQADAPHMDFVFTLCDRAAAETCPTWHGDPVTAHWGVADPTLIAGSDDERLHAFLQTVHDLDARIRIFTSLSLDALDHLALRSHLDAIGQLPSTPPEAVGRTS